MFKFEAKMTEPVLAWMRLADLIVKHQFITPWGICDLAGVSFRADSVRHRIRLRQFRSVTSTTRATLLHRIPDEHGKPISMRRLIRDCTPVIPPDVIMEETQRLIADGFVIQQPRRGLQKVNGWMPMKERVVAVELKLHRVEEAMCQAYNNLTFADESYVALPKELAGRVLLKQNRWSTFFESGVGLLAVGAQNCEVVVRAQPNVINLNPIIQFCSVEKFWRTHPKGN